VLPNPAPANPEPDETKAAYPPPMKATPANPPCVKILAGCCWSCRGMKWDGRVGGEFKGKEGLRRGIDEKI